MLGGKYRLYVPSCAALGEAGERGLIAADLQISLILI
jgi:FKBP-type peptidyl-prolyl cis-trans isomerase